MICPLVILIHTNKFQPQLQFLWLFFKEAITGFVHMITRGLMHHINVVRVLLTGPLSETLPFFISPLLFPLMDSNTTVAKVIYRGARWGQISFRWKHRPPHVHLRPNPLVLHPTVCVCVCAGSGSSNEEDPGCNTMGPEVWWIGFAWSDENKLGYLSISFCLTECCMSSSSTVEIYVEIYHSSSHLLLFL